MKICDICGSLQSAQDNEKRLQTHYEGRLHSGFLKIRNYLEELKERKKERLRLIKERLESNILDESMQDIGDNITNRSNKEFHKSNNYEDKYHVSFCKYLNHFLYL